MPPVPTGEATRTGMSVTCWAISAKPRSRAPPPVSTMPPASEAGVVVRSTSATISAAISRARGPITSAR